MQMILRKCIKGDRQQSRLSYIISIQRKNIFACPGTHAQKIKICEKCHINPPYYTFMCDIIHAKKYLTID